jgi:tetratricopeptide (TPR) repeat protein
MTSGPSLSTRLLLATTCTLGLTQQAVGAEHADRCQRNMVCRVHSEKGVSLSEKKSYAEALSEFQAAYAAEPEPRLLLNIGRSLYRLDRPQEALEHFARYRKAAGSLDSETEQTVRRYELDATMAAAASSGAEPSPAAPTPPSDRLPPRAMLGLCGAGLGLLIIGIGLGAGASGAAREVSQPANSFIPFGQTERDIETRGLNLQTAGAVFDVIGLIGLTAGGASLGTWLYMKKTAPSINVTKNSIIGPGLAGRPMPRAGLAFSFGGP